MKATVLVSSAGRRGQLIECFRDSARSLGFELRILACDLSPARSAACQLADDAAIVPPCRSEEFIPAVLDLCRRHQVRLVVPTIDTELPAYSDHCQSFDAIGVSVSVSSPTVVGVARDKQATFELLRSAGVDAPRTCSAFEYATHPQRVRWPVILKPRGGSSSVGIIRPPSLDDALVALRRDPSLIVQELWQGKEYTVNMYFDRSGELRCAVPHWRIETRAGEVSKGQTEDLAVLRQAAVKIARALPGARGALCFQAIVDERGNYVVFEVNARFGGGYPLAHHAGAQFTTWLLEEGLGLPCTAADRWRPGVTMLRYDTAVFHTG